MEEDVSNYLPTVMFRGTPCTLYSFLRFVYTVRHVAFSSSVYSTSGIGLPLKYKHLQRFIQGGSGAISEIFDFQDYFRFPWDGCIIPPPPEKVLNKIELDIDRNQFDFQEKMV